MDLERRVRRLEKENLRLKGLAVLMLIGIGSIFLMGQDAPVSGQIKTRHFELVDTAGKSLVEIRPEGRSGAAILLRDNVGAFEIALRSRGETAGISVTDTKKKSSAVLEASSEGRRLLFHEPAGLAADLGVGANGPALVIHGPSGDAWVRSGGEGPSVFTTNPQGQQVWRRP